VALFVKFNQRRVKEGEKEKGEEKDK